MASAVDAASTPTDAAADDDVRLDGEPPYVSLLLRDGGNWVSLHSRRDPQREAERLLAAAPIDGASTVFVIGFGLGFIADALEAQGWTGTLVAFESSAAVVDGCLRRRDWTPWLSAGRLWFVTGPAFDGLDQVVPALDPNREAPALLVNPVVARLLPAFTDAARVKASRAWFGARANQDARRRMAGRYLLQTLRNTDAIADAGDVADLAGHLRGLPALVVAAGPSLDRNLTDIARYRDRAVVIAVDTALRPLLAAGIAPDIAVAVDPGDSNARHLVDLPQCPSTTLVTEGSLAPEAIATFRDRLFVFRVSDHHPWPWLRSQGLDRGRLRAWGSVLTTAFDLALHLGCDPVVCAGADLAFTDGRPYARGTVYEEDWQREAAWGRSVEDSWQARLAEWPPTVEAAVDGTKVRTAPHLVAFRDWIVAEAGRAASRTVANATGAGILQGGAVRQLALADVLGPRPPLALSVKTSLDRKRAAASATPRQRPQVPPDVERAWCDFAQTTPLAIADAMGKSRTPVVATAEAVAFVADDVVADNRRDPTFYPELNDADAARLALLRQSHSWQDVILRDASQDLERELREAVQSVDRSTAVVVLDLVGHGQGAQVRRALDAILCDRPDIWLQYHRWHDHTSRVSVLRGDPEVSAPEPHAIDALKWLPAHETAADTLSALVTTAVQPASVIDLGCGAGYWLRAFERHGATRLRGITFRATADAVHASVTEATTADLLAGLPGERNRGERFDLCLAFEVVYQLPAAAHAAFIETCAALSDTVVFSCRLAGSRETSGWARPLRYWAEIFWHHGFLVDDAFRGRVEELWQYPRTIFDGVVVFRRSLSVAQQADASLRTQYLSTVSRLHHLFEQNLWWAQRAFTLERQLGEVSASLPPIVAASRPWAIPSWRMLGEGGATRMIFFRTAAARFYVTDPRAEIHVHEDGRPLPRVGSHAELDSAVAGGWALYRDQLGIRSSDGSDPRTNGRCYAVTLPTFVAWAEEQPLDQALAHGL